MPFSCPINPLICLFFFHQGAKNEIICFMRSGTEVRSEYYLAPLLLSFNCLLVMKTIVSITWSYDAETSGITAESSGVRVMQER